MRKITVKEAFETKANNLFYKEPGLFGSEYPVLKIEYHGRNYGPRPQEAKEDHDETYFVFFDDHKKLLHASELIYTKGHQHETQR